MTASHRDSTPFATTFAIEALRLVDTPESRWLVQRARAFLLDQMEPGAVWRYWPVRPGRAIPADADDTACASVALARAVAGVDPLLAANVATLLANRDACGRFYTWFVPPGCRNDIDSVVNANVVRYLGARHETDEAIDYILEILASEQEQQSYWYYLDDLALYYAVTRAMASVPRFRGAVQMLRGRLSARLARSDVSSSDLLTALATSTLLRLTAAAAPPPEAAQLADVLLQRQADDSGWACEAIYAGPPPPGPYSVWFGSRQLTTVLAIEALALYLRQARRSGDRGTRAP